MRDLTLVDKILVTDDEADILNLAKIILEDAGFTVIAASDGDEAITKAGAEMPDLILMDVVMPGKSGFEACRILKSQPKTMLIPIVVFTVLGRKVDLKMAHEAGADGYLIKPFKAEGLLTEVKRFLKRARAGKFSKQLGYVHGELKGKKILVEYDPSTPYERFVRDFAVEAAFHGEAVVVFTKSGSAVQRALKGDGDITFVERTPQTWLSPLLQDYRDRPLSVVYDNLTDLALQTNFQSAYSFTQSALQMFDPNVTALFLLNPSAHEQREIYSLRGLFSSQVEYGVEGATKVRIS